jgi:two-component system chemotaxis sensor kinase CheA
MSLNETLQQQLIKDLLVESHEGLDRFDRELLTLEQGSGAGETMNVIFRVIHTLKGSAGCLGLVASRRPPTAAKIS